MGKTHRQEAAERARGRGRQEVMDSFVCEKGRTEGKMGKQAAAWLRNELNPSGRVPPSFPSDQVLVQAAGFAPRL